MRLKVRVMITEETVHIKGIPKKLIIFLHGYIDSSPSLDRRLSVLYDTLDDFAIHLPQAPVICEIHENKRQWYSMHRFDPNDDRKLVPTMEECVAFYNRMTLGLKNAYDYLIPYIEQSMAEYNLTPDDGYVCGFSQGAMVALYLGLMYQERFAGIVSFSGILAAAPYLHKHVVSTPDVLLLHGTSDNLIRYAALDYTREQLEQLGCNVATHSIEGGQHMVNDEGLAQAVAFIRSRSEHA